MSNREIGRLLGGISHNTVNQALKRETAPVYKREPVANPSIVPFKEYIEVSYSQKIGQYNKVEKG